MKIREEYTCPLELTHDITKGKWNGRCTKSKGIYGLVKLLYPQKSV